MLGKASFLNYLASSRTPSKTTFKLLMVEDNVNNERSNCLQMWLARQLNCDLGSLRARLAGHEVDV